MKSGLIAVALFTVTAAALGLNAQHGTENPAPPAVRVAPAPPAVQQPRIDVVFVLDTTGSMGGLIEAAKNKIWSIAASMSQAQPAPLIRMGLVAYRDRGDEYVTRVVDLSEDLDAMYATLMQFQASGGGDGPESVNAALHDAVHRMSWSADQDTYKVIFLVGDAPPHMDYQDEEQYPEILQAAVQRGIVVNTIQCGEMAETLGPWQHIASLGGGDYFRVEQDGNAIVMSTPFDERLAALAAELDGTRLYYGSAEERDAGERKRSVAEGLQERLSLVAQAARAAFNASGSGAANLLGDKELVEDFASGRVELDALAPEALPAEIRDLEPEAREKVLRSRASRRDELKREIDRLAAQRAAYLEDQVKARGGADDSLDVKLYGAVREQAAKKGILYEADRPVF